MVGVSFQKKGFGAGLWDDHNITFYLSGGLLLSPTDDQQACSVRRRTVTVVHCDRLRVVMLRFNKKSV